MIICGQVLMFALHAIRQGEDVEVVTSRAKRQKPTISQLETRAPRPTVVFQTQLPSPRLMAVTKRRWSSGVRDQTASAWCPLWGIIGDPCYHMKRCFECTVAAPGVDTGRSLSASFE